MTDDDFDTIESQLGVALPPAYRDLLADDPKPSPLVVDFYELFEDPRLVVDETRRLRIQGFGESRPPGELLVIGDNGCGDYCCLDLSQEPPTVVAYDHERDKYREVAWSIESWRKRSTARGADPT